MKRQLDDIDQSLPQSIAEQDGLQKSIQRINAVFSNVDALLLKKQRIDLALNAEPQIKQKVLRLYVRHEFYAATDAEKSYFLVTVEGMLLDNVYDKTFNLTHFFERISLQSQTDKKSSQGPFMYDWKEEDFPVGGNAHSVQAKVYTDKPSLIKVSLHRSTAVSMRYNISDQLRGVVPYLRFDPSEEEVLLAVWQYIETSGLFVAEKDKRYFRLTEGLKELLLGDRDNPLAVMMVSALRSKLAPHLVPARPVTVEHFLNVTNTPELFALSLKSNYSLRGGGRWPTAVAYSRVGGRVFELEVDVRDQACLRTIATLNKCTALEYHANDRIRLHTEQLAYLARRMQVLEKDRVALATALDLLDGTHAEQPADAVVKAEAVGASASISESVSGEASVVEADQMTLLQACMFPLYERIRRRDPTERFSAPAHTPLASALRATAAAELIRQAQTQTQVQAHYGDSVEMKVEGQQQQLHNPQIHHKLPGQAAHPSASGSASARTEAPVAHYSSLHTLSGFLDVGSDALFQTEKTWLHAASQQVVGEKSKTN